MQKHFLPERIEHLLPDEAEAVDRAARAVVGHLQGFGYRLVMPPLAERLETLLDGGEGDVLSERTLRLTDPIGGGPIGIRADITPQAARIDERHFGKGVNRLCYCGSTLYSRPAKPWLNREQLQVGAELYGCAPLPSATEVLMAATGALAAAGVGNLCVALGHAGIVDEAIAGVAPDDRAAVRRLMQKKDAVGVWELVGEKASGPLEALMAMRGPAEMAGAWSKDLPETERVGESLAQLGELAAVLESCSVECTLDLTGLTGYEYHNGVAFAILGGDALLARGGHYGSADRPACGFSANVRDLVPVVPETPQPESFASLRTFGDKAWRGKIAELTGSGMRCILVDDLGDAPPGCARRLVQDGGGWKLEETG